MIGERGSRVGIDGVGAKHGGAATVLLSVIDAALRHEGVEDVVVWCSPAVQRSFAFPDDQRLQIIDVPRAERGRLNRIWWHMSGLPEAARSAGVDVLLCLGAGGAPPPGVPAATLIQQSLPFSGEAMARCSLGAQLRMHAIRLSMLYSCLRCQAIVVQTSTMRDWVSNGFSIDPSKIHVIRPNATLRERTASRTDTLMAMRSVPTGRRVLYVGNNSPYKNLDALFDAFVHVRNRLPDAALFVTLAPEAAPRNEGVVSLGYLDAASLAEAYRLADLLVMPSLVETVGLPLLEAAAMGTPIAASDRPYAREVCGDSALYFDPLDPASAADAILTVLGNDALRASLGRKGRERADEVSGMKPYTQMIELLVGLARTGRRETTSRPTMQDGKKAIQ